jgi:hypothetical protein
MREAVKALVVARVLEIRRSDGTYVTSLEPELLLGGIASAVELLREHLEHGDNTHPSPVAGNPHLAPITAPVARPGRRR